MNLMNCQKSRRLFLVRGAALTAGVAISAITRPSRAAKAAKSDFFYQDKPKDGKSCSACKFFTPEGTAADLGTCAVIEGHVSRHGWCMAFAPKP
jgi:hypothetical protein